MSLCVCAGFVDRQLFANISTFLGDKVQNVAFTACFCCQEWRMDESVTAGFEFLS